MTKVIGMLVALAMFCAMPAVAFAGGDGTDGPVDQDGAIDQGAAGGDGGDGGGSGGDDDDDGSGGDGGDGGNAGNQACLIQQNAGDDANAECNQSQSFGGDASIGDGDDSDDSEDHDDSDHVGGDHDDSDNVGGGSVESVTLAQTGFDAWVLALIGGLSLAGGAGLLVAQRRGRLHS